MTFWGQNEPKLRNWSPEFQNEKWNQITQKNPNITNTKEKNPHHFWTSSDCHYFHRTLFHSYKRLTFFFLLKDKPPFRVTTFFNRVLLKGRSIRRTCDLRDQLMSLVHNVFLFYQFLPFLECYITIIIRDSLIKIY